MGGNSVYKGQVTHHCFHSISACLKNNIKRLVYTSTYNVVFGGQEIIDGKEDLPYLPLDQVS